MIISKLSLWVPQNDDRIRVRPRVLQSYKYTSINIKLRFISLTAINPVLGFVFGDNAR